MKEKVLLISFVWLTCFCKAQQSSTVIPPSPDAAALAVYGNIPVSTYTGVPNINIPIHTISYRDVQIPIDLSYHASGITVEQDASWVGLAWTLNVGGVITRTVKGGDDLQSINDGYSNIGNPGAVTYKGFPYETADETSTTFATQICAKEIDTEPDMFYFNFLGKSGSFVLERGQNQSLSYISGTPLRMEKIDIRYDKTTFTWIIKTPDGFVYYFNTIELTEVHNGVAAYGQGPERAFFDPSTNGFFSADDIVVSAWYLDKVVSPLGEEVNYVYDVTDIGGAPGTKNSRYGSARISITDKGRTDLNHNTNSPGFGGSEGDCYFPPGQTTVSKIFTNHIYLREINHALGKIVFNKSLREDIIPVSSGLGTFNYLTNAPSYLTWMYNQQGPQKLDNIIFQDKNGSVIKKFEFVYSYFNGSASGYNKYDLKRLRLDKVRECGNSDCNPYYQFYYDETFSLPSKYTNAQDFWGYYNGAHTNPSRIPFGTYLDLTEYKHYSLGDANRQPNPTYMKCATLNKILYPTGGTSEFEFEPHDYSAFGTEAFMLTDFENNIPIGITGLVTTQNDAAEFQTVNFTITDAQAEISANSVMTYYASATSSDPCNVTDPGTIYVGSEPWYSIRKTTETNFVAKRVMSDFLNFFTENYNNHCTSPATPDAIDPIRRKKETYVLSAGTYELKVYRRQGFNIELNIHKTVIHPRTIKLNSNNVIAKTAGGLRIKKITSKERTDATPVVKKYDYTFDLTSQPRTSSGRLMLFPNYHVLYYCTQAQQPLVALLGSSWSNTPLGNSASGSIVGYDKVIESDGENHENGYTEYYFHNREEEGVDHTDANKFITGLPARKITSNGLLREVKQFNKADQILKSETTVYGPAQFQKQIRGVAAQSLYINWLGQFKKTDCNNSLFLVVTAPYPVVSDRWVSEKKTTRIYKDAGNYLETVTDYVYDTQTHLQLKSEQSTSSKNETLKTEYLYPPDAAWIPTDMWQTKFMYSTPVQKKVFRNTNLLTTYKASYKALGNTYVLDKEEDAVGAAALDALNTYNYAANGNVQGILNRSGVPQSFQWGYSEKYPVVVIKNAENSLTTSATTGTAYGSLNMPSSSASTSFTTTAVGNIVITAMGDPGNTYSIQYQLSGSSGGAIIGTLCASRSSVTCNNPESVTLSNMPAGTYTLSISLYDGSGSYMGATYSYPANQTTTTGIKEFFYQGFEEEADAATATPYAGKKYYNGDYTVPYTTPNSRTYMVNYRYLDGTVWKSMTQTFTSNMSLTDGTAIDEVRVYPSDALMTTYTYDPLVGMTSQTDPAGRTTLYEYDGFGRLRFVRDQDKNILKRICYNYQGQEENCKVYYNVAKNGTFTRSCSAGYAGSQVTYTVAAGTYASGSSQADADQKAQDDVNNNGQAFANANGSCLLLYYNVAKSGTYTRSCGSGYVGSQVTYNVAAGTHSSTVSQADADQKAQDDVNNNGQAYANANGTCTAIYYNVAKSGTYTRSCSSGYVGSQVTYNVAAGTHSSTVSQADADQKAQDDVNNNGQAYANANGTCKQIWYNVEKSGSYTRNNCGANTPTTVTYTVAAGSYSSLVSQADADQKAQDDVNANGQNYANNNAICKQTWYNVVKSGSYTRNNCGAGYVAGSVTYAVAAGTYSSIVSQADADQKAQDDVNNNGQAYANANGTCTKIYYNVAKSGNFTKKCKAGYAGNESTYTVPAGTYSSTISQADADQKAQDDVNANGQKYAQENGDCTREGGGRLPKGG